MANKVVFGLENVHVCTYTVGQDGTVTLGTPMHVPGAVSMSLESETEENTMYADNVKYFTSYSDNGFTGELEMAMFDDDFKTTFLGYVELDNGGIAQVKGGTNPAVCIMFESKGDAEKRRGILYNVALGAISREYSTTTENVEPVTATLPFTVTGDNGTGIVKAEFAPTASAYATLFTTPPVPALPTP